MFIKDDTCQLIYTLPFDYKFLLNTKFVVIRSLQTRYCMWQRTAGIWAERL